MKFPIIELLIQKKYSISTMESCTGGLLASTITDYEGASNIISGAFVTYNNSAKIQQGVPEDIIKKYGVYSKETAEAMAEAVQKIYNTKIAIGVTGTLGRLDPNNKDSISGEVFYSILYDNSYYTYHTKINPNLKDRHAMKEFIIEEILHRLEKILNI